MRLLTKEQRRELPPLGSMENQDDPMLRVKLFAPWLNWAWYISEFDGEDVCFGLSHDSEREWAFFNLAEIESLRGPWGARVEQDRAFSPTRASVLKAA